MSTAAAKSPTNAVLCQAAASLRGEVAAMNPDISQASWTCDLCAERGHAAVVSGDQVWCPAAERRITRGQACGFEVGDLRWLAQAHRQDALQLEAMIRDRTASGKSSRGAFPELRGLDDPKGGQGHAVGSG